MIHNIKNKDVHKFLHLSNNPAKALNAVVSFSFICFNVMWIILRIRYSFVLETAFHSFIFDILLILLSILFSLCLLIVIHRKKEKQCMRFLLITIIILFFPYATITRNVFLFGYQKIYQEAAQYAVFEYGQNGNLTIAVPEKFEKNMPGNKVFILYGDEKEIGIFFPRAIQYNVMKGFVCHIDRRAMEVAGRWEVTWEWRDFVSFAEISESGQEGETR